MLAARGMKIIFDAEDFKSKPRGIVKTTLCIYCACHEAMPVLRITRKPPETRIV
jgi:hypothetical protein